MKIVGATGLGGRWCSVFTEGGRLFEEGGITESTEGDPDCNTSIPFLAADPATFEELLWSQLLGCSS